MNGSNAAADRFDGEIILSDGPPKAAFLKAKNGSQYLLDLDPESVGDSSPQREARAYQKFSTDPGQGGRLSCTGFVKTSGSEKVLHVVTVS